MSTPTSEELGKFVDQLVGLLPDAVKRTMEGHYAKLLADHIRLNGGGNSFLVGSLVHFENQLVLPLSRVVGVPRGLHQSLVPAFLAWEKPFKELNVQLDRIRQTLNSILMRAKSWQDVRNMVPDYYSRPLHHLPPMAGLQRTTLDLYAGRPVAFGPISKERLDREAVWDPRLLNMYERVGGIIDLYLGYKLL